MSSVKQLVHLILKINFILGIFLPAASTNYKETCINCVKLSEVQQSSQNEKEAIEFPIHIIEIQPRFLHGTDSLLNCIYSNLKWPGPNFHAEGTVVITFVIDKNGIAKEHKILKRLSEKADQEAMRVIKLLKDWTPGTQRGKAVDVQYNIPVKFRLE